MPPCVAGFIVSGRATVGHTDKDKCTACIVPARTSRPLAHCSVSCRAFHFTTHSSCGDAYRDGLPIRISVRGRTTRPPLRPNKCAACMFGRATAHYSRPQLPPASMVCLANDRATVCAVLVRRSCFPASPSRYACSHSNGRIIRTVHPKGSRVIL